MSRGYYKTYGRKVSAPISHASIQFDKLFRENSNRPSASKSAGTVGKWGITSFTSIRSTNLAFGRKEESFKKAEQKKAESFNTTAPAPAPAIRPKKFFKSRNAEQPASSSTSSSSGSSSVRKYNRNLRSSQASKKSTYMVSPNDDEDDEGDEENVEDAVETRSPTSSSAPAGANQPHNPPIVLRIFKGTSQLLTEDNIYPKKEGRRRSHSSDHESVSPKRHKSKKNYEDLESLRKDLEDDPPQSPLGDERVLDLPPEDQIEAQDDEPQPPEELVDDRKALLNVLEDQPDLPCLDDPLSSECQPLPEEDLKQEFKEEVTSDSESTVSDKAQAQEEIKVDPHSPPENKSAQEVRERPAKKGSIFKARGGEKRQAHYIHKWCDIKEDGAAKPGQAPPGPPVKVEGHFEPDTLTRVTNYNVDSMDFDEEPEPITSVTCSKKTKEFYTVVRNVKRAHQIQESGEFQEFNDDVEYILDALLDKNPIGTRCLSAITLATKCMAPAFRMHVRAHGTVTKFFKALHDATKDQRLGMCTATVMFVLSQDRLNMDLDRDSLELMLSLLESETSHNSALDDCGLSDAQLQKTKDRVRSLCQEIQEQGHGKHLNLDNITVGHLAMETLLSLTSRRAGEWFKEELRDLGGLEHIIKTVVDTCQPVNTSVFTWTPNLIDRLRKADRCLRVLENVTLHNEENNNYLLTYGDGILIDTVVRVFRVCDQNILLYPVTSVADKDSIGAAFKDCLLSILKVLINLTHDFNNKSFGSTLTGMKQGVIETCFHVLLQTPDYVPDEQKFDLTVLGLILLINLVEHSDSNRKLIIEAKAPPNPHTVFEAYQQSAVGALVSLFIKHEELAKTEEKNTDAILDGEKPTESQQQKSQEEYIEETVANLLQKAGRNMEHTLIAAYVAILIGYLTLNNETYEQYVRGHMPDRSYSLMLAVLTKFFNFMNLTASAGSVSSRGIKATEMLIKHLTETDKAGNPPIKSET